MFSGFLVEETLVPLNVRKIESIRSAHRICCPFDHYHVSFLLTLVQCGRLARLVLFSQITLSSWPAFTNDSIARVISF